MAGQWDAGGVESLVSIEGLRGGSIVEVRAAFERATRDVSPPAQYRLLLDAKTAAVEGDNRRAVIDAGTASEVAVATAIGGQLPRKGLDTETVDTIFSQANGLAGLIVLSDSLPFSEVKAHLSELADRVERQHDRILVTRNGRPSFVLMRPDDLDRSAAET